MARAYTQIFCSIWDDAHFCALSSDAQRTYFMLTSQDDIGAAGVLAIRLRRWSRTLPPSDRDKLEPSIKELVAAGYVYEDDDTEELLVRSFVKWDGGYKHSKRVLAVVASAEAIKSQSLRNVMASELDKLDVKHAIQVRIESHSIANPEAFDSQSDGNGQAIDSGRVVVTYQPTEPQAVIRNPETRNLKPGAIAETGDNGPPRQFCEKHPNGTDEACRACGRARTEYETWDTQQRILDAKARDQRIRAAQDAAINADLNRGHADRTVFDRARAEADAAIAARRAATEHPALQPDADAERADITPQVAAFIETAEQAAIALDAEPPPAGPRTDLTQALAAAIARRQGTNT